LNGQKQDPKGRFPVFNRILVRETIHKAFYSLGGSPSTIADSDDSTTLHSGYDWKNNRVMGNSGVSNLCMEVV
jgi:hypothetical protein